MSDKPYRRHIDDCYDCCYYQESCDGKEKYDKEISGRGVARCKNIKKDLTEAEIDAILSGETL